MDNEIHEPLNQFDPDLRDLMMDCITEKDRGGPTFFAVTLSSAAGSPNLVPGPVQVQKRQVAVWFETGQGTGDFTEETSESYGTPHCFQHVFEGTLRCHVEENIILC